MVGCSDEVINEAAVRPAYTYTVPTAQSEVERSFSGQLYASQGAALSFEVGGRVVKLIAAQGGRFEAGDTLAQLDNTDFLTRQNDAEGLLVQATQELRRVQRLFESENASQSDLDSSVAKESSNRANFDLAKQQTDNSTLKMPYTGIISSVEVDVQQVLSAGQTVFSVQGEGPMEFEFGVPSNLIAQIEPGLSLSVTISDEGGRRLPATVKKVAPSSAQNTTYMVTAVLDEADRALRDGMDGEAIISLPNAAGPHLSVPLPAVLGASGGKSFVWLVTPNASGTATLSRQSVAVGALLAEGQVEVLNGLAAGEQILSRGVHRAEEGMRVRLQD